MKTVFGVHLILETTLSALDESALPADLDAMLPAKRQLSSDEITRVPYLCATHLRGRVSRSARPEFERLYALAHRTVTRPPGAPMDWSDLGEAAKRDMEYGRGVTKIAAIAAYIPSASSNHKAVELAGQAGALTAKALLKDPNALHAFLSDLCHLLR